jgi:hypothetical protein
LRKYARTRPQPPPGRVLRTDPISSCAVKEIDGLRNSLTRPGRFRVAMRRNKGVRAVSNVCQKIVTKLQVKIGFLRRLA